MAYLFVTGIDTDGKVLGRDDSLTVTTSGAITVEAETGNGIFSTALAARAAIFGDVAAGGDGVHLEASESTVFVGQSGKVTGGKVGVLLGSVAAREVSLQNDGTIMGQIGGVRLEGTFLDFVNTGTVSVPMGNVGMGLAAVTLASNTLSYLTNTGTISAGLFSDHHKAVVGGAGVDIIYNKGLIRGRIDLGAGNDRYYGQEGFCEGGSISLGTGQNMAYGGRGAEVFSLVQEGDRLDDFVDGGAGIDGLTILDGDINVRVDLRVTVRQETGVGGLTLQNVENLFTGDGWDQVTGSAENNFISTGSGNDTLEGGLGDDDLRGGDGNDTAIFSGSTRATVDLRLQGQPQNTGHGFDTLDALLFVKRRCGSD